MRLEKGFLHWKADILTEFDPFETGLGRFVRMEKDDFVGKAALEQRVKYGPLRKRVTLEVHCDDRPAHPGASVIKDGKVAGTVTSGGWGHRVGKNLAYAFVEPQLATEPATGLTMDLLGDVIDCAVVDHTLYDPEMLIPRG